MNKIGGPVLSAIVASQLNAGQGYYTPKDELFFHSPQEIADYNDKHPNSLKLGGTSNSVHIEIQGKKYLIVGDFGNNHSLVGFLKTLKSGDVIIRGGVAHLRETVFNKYKDKFKLKEYRIGGDIRKINKKSYIVIGTVVSSTRGVGKANTNTGIIYLQGGITNGKKFAGRFDLSVSVESVLAYGKNKTYATLFGAYYPNKNVELYGKYSTQNFGHQLRGELGLKGTWGGDKSGIEWSPYLGIEKSSGHLEVGANIEKDIAQKDLPKVSDKLKEILFKYSSLPKSYFSGEFTKRLDENHIIPKINLAPITNPDKAEVEEEQKILINVLKNDKDPEGKKLTIVGVSGNGFSLSGNKVLFNAKGKKAGKYIGYYIVSDGEKTTKEKITITVTPKKVTPPKPAPNHAPEANSDIVSTAYNTAITVDVLSNDTDPDRDNLVITSLSNQEGGTFEIVDGKIKFTPEDGFSGQASCKYTISDRRGGISEAQLIVNVAEAPNHAPEANDINVDATRANNYTVDVSSLISDSDGDNLTISIESYENFGGSDLEFEEVSVNGTDVYVKVNGGTGDVKIIYKVDDGKGGTDTGEIIVEHLDGE